MLLGQKVVSCFLKIVHDVEKRTTLSNFYFFGLFHLKDFFFLIKT